MIDAASPQWLKLGPQMDTSQLTPMMKQYWEIKSQHLDKILLYRMGDFYEIFHDDAKVAAPILNIALTSRNKSLGNEVPMCGVPHFSIGPQINKLLGAGLKVAICDQVEDPKAAKGIVKRAVTRIVTPGLVYDPESLSAGESNHLVAVIPRDKGLFDLASLDASTGELDVAKRVSLGELLSWFARLEPREILIPSEFSLPFELPALVTKQSQNPSHGIEEFLLNYVRQTQGGDFEKSLRAPEELPKTYLNLLPQTIKGLEIFKNSEDQYEGSLVHAVDQTKTPMGLRLLKRRLRSPFVEKSNIELEHQKVSEFKENIEHRKLLRSKLSELGDFERRVVRVSSPLCNARDLQTIAEGLGIIFEIQGKADADLLRLKEKLDSNLRDELPLSTKEGGLIKPGVHHLLDEYIEMDEKGAQKLVELESRERAATQIPSLKVKYNNIYGYSFEITKTHLEKVPKNYVRKQTLTGAERFVTKELSELEEKILTSRQKRHDFEYEIFQNLRTDVLKLAISLLKLSREMAELDLRSAFAELADLRNFCRPEFTNEGISITALRHPVLEMRQKEAFIPNDVVLENGHCMLLTGPNMAGKSTILRSAAIAGILAQIGCFVPASKAKLPIFDQVFSRIGASDNLSRGMSTFKVEIVETCEIIKSATQNSLVILDEIGRGTSTYDGMSLAQAILEHFVDQVKSYTFFATHYHELTRVAESRHQVKNYHMSIKEFEGSLVFLRKLTPGPTSKSYGIEVARLSGLPSTITSRAQILLKDLVKKGEHIHSRQLDLSPQIEKSEAQNRLISRIRDLNIDSLSPLEALIELNNLKKESDQGLVPN